MSAATVQFLQTHQAEYPGVSVETVAQRTYPQGGTTATHVLGYVGDIQPAYLAAHPNDGYTQGSQVGVSGIEAQYEPYLRGVAGRQALSVDSKGTVVGTLSTTAPQIGDTVVLNIDTGLQQAVQNDLPAADPGRPPHARRGRRRVSRRRPTGRSSCMNPQNGQVLALASYPTYDLNEWVGGISTANFTALQAVGRGEQQRHRGPVHARARPSSSSRPRRRSRTGLITPGYYVRRHRHVQDPGLPGTRRQQRHRVRPQRRPGRHRRASTTSPTALTVSSDSFFYNLGDMFWNDRAQYGDTPIQNEATAYGEGTITGIDLPGEAQGRVDSHADPGQAARRGTQGLPLRGFVVHRRQHRDGLRAG